MIPTLKAIADDLRELFPETMVSVTVFYDGSIDFAFVGKDSITQARARNWLGRMGVEVVKTTVSLRYTHFDGICRAATVANKTDCGPKGAPPPSGAGS